MSNASKAITYIMSIHFERAEVARVLREARNNLRTWGVPAGRGRRELARELALLRGYKFTQPRITHDEFRNLMRTNLEYGLTRFGPIVAADGYAFCGLEDARADAQAYAREQAYLQRRALRYLR